MSTSTAIKKLTMVTAGAVLIALQIGGAAQAVVLTFDENTSNIGSISDGYGELNWSNFSYADSSWTSAYEGSGYINGNVSGNYVGFNRYGESATLTSSNGFDFSSAYLTAAWNNGLSITVEGLKDGTQLYSKTVVVDTTSSALLNFDYLGIDELKFTSFGGVNAGFEDDRGRDGEQFVLDNFAFNLLPAAPDPVAIVPDPVTVIPAPVTAPDPVTVIPAPVTVIPAPVTGIPAPVAIVPDPVTVIPDPVAIVPDPVTVIPDPVAVLPDPVVIIPSPGDGVTDPGMGGAPDPGTPTPIPYEPSSGLGLLTLGAFGAGLVLKRKLQQKGKAKNFI